MVKYNQEHNNGFYFVLTIKQEVTEDNVIRQRNVKYLCLI